MQFQPPHRPEGRTPHQSLDRINLELDRGLILARFCRGKGNLANADDLRKAKAAYDRAIDMFGRQTHLTARQKRGLERKLKRFEQCIRSVEMAAPPIQLGSNGPLAFPAASLLNHKP
jgi:hypothetical protein